MKIYNDRPYIVCHILSSIDGRISGNLFSAPEAMQAQPIYSTIRKKYNCDAVLNGTVTCAQIYADGYIDNLPKTKESISRKDFVAKADENKYVVCVDTEGVLRWSRNIVERGGQRSHVIEILTEKVSDDYISYLQKLGISYIFAGKDSFNIPLAMKKLKQLFEINTLMITGGGVIDWSFLQAGMIDEVSLVIAPVVTGEKTAATVFDQSEFVSGGVAKPFELANVQKYNNSILWLDYKVK